MAIANMPELVEINGTNLHETQEAVLFDFGRDKNVWIPKSLMEDWPDKGRNGEVLIQEWAAVEKDLV